MKSWAGRRNSGDSMEVEFNHRRRDQRRGSLTSSLDFDTAPSEELTDVDLNNISNIGFSFAEGGAIGNEHLMDESNDTDADVSTSSVTEKGNNLDKRKVGDTEVTSKMIRNFDTDGGDEGEDEEFFDNDESAYNAIFGRDVTSKSGSGGGSGHYDLQESLERERKTKCVLFAFLMIVAIMCLSTIVSQKRLLRLQNDEYSDNNKAYDGYGGHGGRPDDDFLKDDDDDDRAGGYESDAQMDVYSGDNSFNNDKYMENHETDLDGLFGSGGEEEEEEEGPYDAFNEENQGETTTTGTTSTYDQDNEGQQGNYDQKPEEEEEPMSSSQGVDNDFDNMKILEPRFGNVNDTFQGDGSDLPFLFFVPRTGGALMEKLLLQCNDLVAASGRNAIGEDRGYEPVKSLILFHIFVAAPLSCDTIFLFIPYYFVSIFIFNCIALNLMIYLIL